MNLLLRFTIFSFAIILSKSPSANANEISDAQLGLGIVVNRVEKWPSGYSPLTKPNSHFSGFIGSKGKIYDWLTVDISLSYNRFQFFKKLSNGGEVSEIGNRFHIPILFRWTLLDFFSVGAGFYGSYRLGSVESPLSGESENGTSAFDYGEHGVESAIGLNLPMGKRSPYSVIVDVRNSYTLTSRSGESKSWARILVGFYKKL